MANDTVATPKEASELKTRVAAAWTIARTMLPNAPEAAQIKFATAQLALDTPTLKAALRQTAINAHHTRLAESREQVHKEDLNDKLPESSELTKEESAVKSEVKGKAVAAATKKADDRKENGEQPPTYDEGKRTEPAETDAGKAGDREKDTIDKSDSDTKIKAAGKKCVGDKCKGCAECKDKKDEKKKAAVTKKAEGEDEKGEKAPPFEKKPEAETEKAEGEKAADEAAAEGAGEAVEGATEVADEEKNELADDSAAKDEEFDPEKTDILEAIDEAKGAIDKIEEAITEEEGNDLDVPSLLDGTDDQGDLGADQGDELDVSAIFGDDNMDARVDSLANENDELGIAAAFDGDFEGLGSLTDGGEDDNLFSNLLPTDAADMEAKLDQEDNDPGALFARGPEENDPLAALFASVKQAAGDDVVKPGELADMFETEIKGAEGRDSETDHDGDLLAEIADSIKDESREDHRDQVADLKEPGKTAATKKAAPVMRVLKPTEPAPKVASTRGLASMLFQDDDDY